MKHQRITRLRKDFIFSDDLSLVWLTLMNKPTHAMKLFSSENCDWRWKPEFKNKQSFHFQFMKGKRSPMRVEGAVERFNAESRLTLAVVNDSQTTSELFFWRRCHVDRRRRRRKKNHFFLFFCCCCCCCVVCFGGCLHPTRCDVIIPTKVSSLS